MFTLPAAADPDDPLKITDETRTLGLIVCRGTAVMAGVVQLGLWSGSLVRTHAKDDPRQFMSGTRFARLPLLVSFIIVFFSFSSARGFVKALQEQMPFPV